MQIRAVNPSYARHWPSLVALVVMALFTYWASIGLWSPAQEICHNIPEQMRRDYIQPGVGHYGVFSGRRFRTETYPRVRDFMRSFHSNTSRGVRRLKLVAES